MVEISLCELRNKEVVNVADGKRLGRIFDMVFTINGGIQGIVVPGDRTLFKPFGGADSVFIPWNSICKIGDDVILVELGNSLNSISG